MWIRCKPTNPVPKCFFVCRAASHTPEKVFLIRSWGGGNENEGVWRCVSPPAPQHQGSSPPGAALSSFSSLLWQQVAPHVLFSPRKLLRFVSFFPLLLLPSLPSTCCPLLNLDDWSGSSFCQSLHKVFLPFPVRNPDFCWDELSGFRSRRTSVSRMEQLPSASPSWVGQISSPSRTSSGAGNAQWRRRSGSMWRRADRSWDTNSVSGTSQLKKTTTGQGRSPKREGRI